MIILKIGSTGEAVKTLQAFLKITVDGQFGPKTESAVKTWQVNHGLTPDGIVGKQTWLAMGIANTDGAERPDIVTQSSNATGINIVASYMPKGQYYEGPTKKEWLFLHHTAGWHNPFGTVNGWGRDDRGQVATEFVLGGQSVKGNDNTQDGIIVQAFPTGGYGWHLGTGRSAMHTNSVGIEVCNFGQITDGKTYVGTPAHADQIVKLRKSFRGHQYWHKYSDKQIVELKKLILYIANRDSIDVRKGLIELIRTKGVYEAFDFFDVDYCSKHKGLWNHTNVMRGKVDMFPQDELVDMLLSL